MHKCAASTSPSLCLDYLMPGVHYTSYMRRFPACMPIDQGRIRISLWNCLLYSDLSSLTTYNHFWVRWSCLWQEKYNRNAEYKAVIFLSLLSCTRDLWLINTLSSISLYCSLKCKPSPAHEQEYKIREVWPEGINILVDKVSLPELCALPEGSTNEKDSIFHKVFKDSYLESNPS